MKRYKDNINPGTPVRTSTPITRSCIPEQVPKSKRRKEKGPQPEVIGVGGRLSTTPRGSGKGSGVPLILLSYEGSTDTTLLSELKKSPTKRPSVPNETSAKIKPSNFSQVWNNRRSQGTCSNHKSYKPCNRSIKPNPSHTPSSLTSSRTYCEPSPSFSNRDDNVTVSPTASSPGPVSIHGSPTMQRCLKPVPSRPNSGRPNAAEMRTRAPNPSCIPTHPNLASSSFVKNVDPDNIEINFEVGSLDSFSPVPHRKNRESSESRTTGNVSFTSSSSAPSTPCQPGPNLPWDKLENSNNSFTRTQSTKSSSFMKIIKKAKLGSFRSKSVGRMNAPSPPPSPSLSPQLHRSNETVGSQDDRSLIRIWADQVDGGVEGYKGFLIRPDTTANELLTTVQKKLRLSGHSSDYFLCATFQSDEIPDRPLMDSERPLQLHNQWSQNYRFELRHKPTVIIMVYGGARLVSSPVPFIRGAVEVTEDAPAWRLIAELCRRYDLDTSGTGKYNIVERLGGLERILNHEERPAICQKRWKPHQDGQFVLIPPSPSANTSFTDITPMMKNDRSVSVDSCSSFTFPSDVSFCVPDFESAEHDSLNRSGSSDLLQESIVSHCSSNTKHILNIGIPRENINIGFQEMQNRWCSSPLVGSPRKRTQSSENGSIEDFLFSDEKDQYRDSPEKFDIMCGLRPELSQETPSDTTINSQSSQELSISPPPLSLDLAKDELIPLEPPTILLDTVDTNSSSPSNESSPDSTALATPRNLSDVSLQMSWDNFSNDEVAKLREQQETHVKLLDEIKKTTEEEDEREEMESISTVLLEQSLQCYKVLELKSEIVQEKLIHQLNNPHLLEPVENDAVSLSSSTNTLYDLSLEDDAFGRGGLISLNNKEISAKMIPDSDDENQNNGYDKNVTIMDVSINIDCDSDDMFIITDDEDDDNFIERSINIDDIDDSFSDDLERDEILDTTLTSTLKPSLFDEANAGRPKTSRGVPTFDTVKNCDVNDTAHTNDLKDALERMKHEIDEVLDGYSESYSTSLDSSRHEFIDSPYGDGSPETSNFDIPRPQTLDISVNADIGVLIEDPYIDDEMLMKSQRNDHHDTNYTMSVSVTYMSDTESICTEDNIQGQCFQLEDQVDPNDIQNQLDDHVESDDINDFSKNNLDNTDAQNVNDINDIKDATFDIRLIIDQLSKPSTSVMSQNKTGLRSRSMEFSHLKNIFEGNRNSSPNLSTSLPLFSVDKDFVFTSFGPADQNDIDDDTLSHAKNTDVYNVSSSVLDERDLSECDVDEVDVTVINTNITYADDAITKRHSSTTDHVLSITYPATDSLLSPSLADFIDVHDLELLPPEPTSFIKDADSDPDDVKAAKSRSVLAQPSTDFLSSASFTAFCENVGDAIENIAIRIIPSADTDVDDEDDTMVETELTLPLRETAQFKPNPDLPDTPESLDDAALSGFTASATDLGTALAHLIETPQTTPAGEIARNNKDENKCPAASNDDIHASQLNKFFPTSGDDETETGPSLEYDVDNETGSSKPLSGHATPRILEVIDLEDLEDYETPEDVCMMEVFDLKALLARANSVDVVTITSQTALEEGFISETDAIDAADNKKANCDDFETGVENVGLEIEELKLTEYDDDKGQGAAGEINSQVFSLSDKLRNLKRNFRKDKFKEDDYLYDIKLPCIWEITNEDKDSTSPQFSKCMEHADLKRQYKNLLAEIEETKPKLRQLEVLQGELGSMQKAYHELKEQALRMSAEQEMQKGQIEDEIKKLRMSNADLVRKTKDSKAEAVVSTIMELEKLYSDRITALEKALVQKDAMVGDLEEQNKNMMSQLNLNRRQSVQLETANELLHKRNEVLHVERSEGELNPAQFFDSDNQRLALLAKQCDALQQTVSSLESTLVLRVKELNETYKDLDDMRSDLRSAEVARIEAEAQLDVHKREVKRLSTVNEDFAMEIKDRIDDNGRLEQENRHLNENLESIQLQYNDTKDRVSRLENALLSQEKALNAYKDAEKGARNDLTNLEKKLEVSGQQYRVREDEIKKLRKEVEKAKKGTTMYNLCNAVKPGETLELISVDLPSVTENIPRGLYLKQGNNGVYLDKIDINSSAGRLHRLACGDRVVEINLQDVSNATFEATKREFDSPRAMQLVVVRIAPDVREESKLRAEALKDQMTSLVVDLDKTAKLCQSLQGEVAVLKDELANVKAKQRSELESAGNQKNLEELHALKALLTQKDQYLKTLETTVKSKNELLVTLEMDSHRSPRATPNSSVSNRSQLSPQERSIRLNGSKEDSNSISELVNRYG